MIQVYFLGVICGNIRIYVYYSGSTLSVSFIRLLVHSFILTFIHALVTHTVSVI